MKAVVCQAFSHCKPAPYFVRYVLSFYILHAPQRSSASTLAAIERRWLTSPTRRRPGRQLPRHKRSAAFRLRFAKSGKRVMA